MGPGSRPTTFQQHGLASGGTAVSGRWCVVTVDFEAFSKQNVEAWITALKAWRDAMSRYPHFGTDFFVSVEDAVALRHDAPERYAEFMSLLRDIQDQGAAYHLHNHRVFDRATGKPLTDPARHTKHVAGYNSQASMFYDVCRTHRIKLADWLEEAQVAFRDVLSDGELASPAPTVFRAGGFDHGSSRQEQ